MTAAIIRPGCRSCRLKEAENGKLFCRANPPAVTAIVANIAVKGPDGKDRIIPQVIGHVTSWPEVQSHWWCGKHSLLVASTEAAA